ncbi:MAG TPA: flagellar export protein FliJ [Planctomycetota bacterium]|nr:flagellar export protein FliJ [Planctomycetota bacterium]
MKKFSFRFGRLEKIRERDEETALLRLSLAQTDLAREQKILAALLDEVQGSGSQLFELVKESSNRDLLCNADAFRRSANGAACRQRGSVSKAAQGVAEKQDEFQKAHQKAEGIRKLHERQRSEHRRVVLREEQKHLDEIGARKRAGRSL